nr:MAG TPA: hypothetical protein [Caudoviricetes sp.]
MLYIIRISKIDYEFQISKGRFVASTYRRCYIDDCKT